MTFVLTRKGYQIPLHHLNDEQLARIKHDLTVEPKTIVQILSKKKKFPIYSIDDTHIYVPHYYGIANFGIPKYEIPEGDDIEIAFNGKIRDIQEDVVNTYIEHVKKAPVQGGLLDLYCGAGKCLGKDTEILMYDGTIKKVQDVVVGDLLMGDDSTPRTVLSLARGREQMYRVSNNKRDSYICNESHIMSLKESKSKNIVDISVKDYLNLPKDKLLLGYKVSVKFANKEIAFDPYLIGIWLGDGHGLRIRIQSSKIMKYIIELFKEKHETLYLQYSGYRYDYKINGITSSNSFKKFLKDTDMIKNKHIPSTYLVNSIENRTALLAGILDSLGYYEKRRNCYHIKLHMNERFLNDIVYLVRSLGYAVSKKQKGEYFYCYFTGQNIDNIPVLCDRKKAYYRNINVDLLSSRIHLERLNVDNYYGFEIDGNRRFVLGDFTVTHNTVLSLNIISKLKKKTLIIVHKEFLLNQWVERISQFLPTARVGRIQGKVIDIKDKDIVIGMLQSLSMKDYPEGTFDSFGNCILDECFPYEQLVSTEMGPRKIGDLYDCWENNQQLPKVLSYNHKTKETEYKNVTYAWKKTNPELLEFCLGKQNIKCTKNHRILTPSGYKEANLLKIGDLITCNYKEENNEIANNEIANNEIANNEIAKDLNEDQYQILLGSFLGSSNIQILDSMRYRLEVNHSTEEIDYGKWKASMFNIPLCEAHKDMQCEAHTKHDGINFTTQIIDLPSSKILCKNYSCPQWVLDDLDVRGLAIWWMDNGSLSHDKAYGTLSTSSFDEDSNLRIVNKLETMGVESNYVPKDKCLYFNRDSMMNLFNIITPYAQPSVAHKFSNEVIQNYQYQWDKEFLQTGTLKIQEITRITFQQNNFVFDIEVEDNHNFIVCDSSGTGPIVHNCHHISSEVFSQVLQKIVTRYILGLSATMNRKDGTTYVFKMYLGDIVYSLKREKTDTVEVRAINYNSTDEEFNETILDFRQKPQYSSMIVKLCDYQPRSDFIIQVLQDMVTEDPNQQIMILAHNKSLLTYLHDKVAELDIGTVGYYVGGMKKEALEETTTKQIVIATYSMASEALDIKTLTTLIMATPKTDIEQSVGRILRECHAKPIVVDIIDKHEMFSNQWKKRKTFYRKCGYKIIGTNNNDYTPNIDEWKVVYQPKQTVDSTKDSTPTEELFLPTPLAKESSNLLDEIANW